MGLYFAKDISTYPKFEDRGFRHLFLRLSDLSDPGFIKAGEWCAERFGERYTIAKPSGSWGYVAIGGIVLVEDDAAFEFKLRWC